VHHCRHFNFVTASYSLASAAFLVIKCSFQLANEEKDNLQSTASNHMARFYAGRVLTNSSLTDVAGVAQIKFIIMLLKRR
jgi:hypothetical protein